MLQMLEVHVLEWYVTLENLSQLVLMRRARRTIELFFGWDPAFVSLSCVPPSHSRFQMKVWLEGGCLHTFRERVMTRRPPLMPRARLLRTESLQFDQLKPTKPRNAAVSLV